MSHSVLKLMCVHIRTKLILNANEDPKKMREKVVVGSRGSSERKLWWAQPT